MAEKNIEQMFDFLRVINKMWISLKELSTHICGRKVKFYGW